MKLKIVFVLLISFLTVFPQDSVQTFLSLSSTGVDEFHKMYPEYDGRGTIIIILDTGVDMGIDGLTTTTTGKTKVIDVQDFTGEGDINLYDCKVDEEDGKKIFVNESESLKAAGADKLKLKALDNKYFIGALKESDLKNSESDTEDLNGNGSDSDKYVVVVFQTKEGNETFWVAYFDTNDNGDLSDEKPVRTYKEKYDTFQIPNENGLPQLTFAINIFPAQKKISLHFDDGAHGTHVAGIASGYHIGGTYLEGVAPGAQVISLKIGNNKFSGGATVSQSMKRAFIYADSISKEKTEPCIINMSFGIGSEIEGRSDMELFLDSLLTDNPYLYVCLSNGNEGPGISTAGLPSCSDHVLSSGAVLPKEIGRDLYGAELKKDQIFFFSSRGGEVRKPDICSPGASTSTVPNWSERDRMGGTSMASPYTAGVLSCLLSGIRKEFPDVKIPSLLLYKIIRNSAVKMEGYSILDEGGGYINIINAYKLLKKYIDLGEIKNFESYTITSFAPDMPGSQAPNLYIRNGLYLTGDETYNYIIKRDNFQKVNKFYRIYNISSTADWLKPVQRKTYIRNDQNTSISVKIDKSKLNEPGLYTGKIIGTRDDRTKMPEFEMWASVVIPYQFDELNNYMQSFQNQEIDPGRIKRYFIETPAGSGSMGIKLSSGESKYSRCRFWLFKPDGEVLYTSRFLNSEKENESIERYFYNFTPGVYELDIEASYRSDKVSNYNLSVQFSGIKRLGDGALDSSNTSIRVINLYNNARTYNLSGKILGFHKKIQLQLNGTDSAYIPFVLKRNEASKEFDVSLSKGDFNKITDFSLIIFDKDGNAVIKEALTYKDAEIKIENTFRRDSVSLTLALYPAFANKPGDMKININEKTTFNYPENFSVVDNVYPAATLYPEIVKKLDCVFSEPAEKIPGDSEAFGKIYFESEISKKIEYEIPVNFNF